MASATRPTDGRTSSSRWRALGIGAGRAPTARAVKLPLHRCVTADITAAATE